MADERLLAKIHSLSDLELASLLCLIAREHCLISTEPDSVDELAEELRLVAAKTFNLSSAIVNCDAHTTLDGFAGALLIHPARAPPSPGNTRSVSPYRPRNELPQSSSPGPYPQTGPSPHIGGPGSPSSPSIGASGGSSQGSPPRIANVILAKDLDRAPRAVQIQALELLRTRRIFTRTNVQTAPKQFLFIALVGAANGRQARVTPHLNDFLYLAHWHDPEEDGFPYLDEELGGQDGGDEGPDDGASTTSSDSVVKVKRHQQSPSVTGLGLTASAGPRWLASNNNSSNNNKNSTSRRGSSSSSSSSVSHPKPGFIHPHNLPTASSSSPPTPSLFTESDISQLSQLSRSTHISIEITRYQANLVSFLRTHRAVAPGGGGITPAATRHLAQLSKSLAPLHGIDYVTPSLVALAARKVYLHRIETVGAAWGGERSLQWGSDPRVVAGLVEGVGAEEVVEEVLGLVKAPV